MNQSCKKHLYKENVQPHLDLDSFDITLPNSIT